MEKFRLQIFDPYHKMPADLYQALQDTDYQLLEQTSTLNDALNILQKHQPHILLTNLCMDACLMHETGWQVLATFQVVSPHTKVILLSCSLHPMCMARAITYGAEGYLPLSTPIPQILETIGIVIKELHVWNPKLLQSILSAVTTQAMMPANQDELPLLTEAEQRVLHLLGKGYENSRIATTLDISQNTVKTHMRHLFKKINVNDRTQAAIWAVKHGIA